MSVNRVNRRFDLLRAFAINKILCLFYVKRDVFHANSPVLMTTLQRCSHFTKAEVLRISKRWNDGQRRVEEAASHQGTHESQQVRQRGVTSLASSCRRQNWKEWRLDVYRGFPDQKSVVDKIDRPARLESTGKRKEESCCQ